MKTFWISNEQLQLCLDVGEPNEPLKRFYSKCTVNENCTDDSTQQLAEVTKREATSLDCARAASDGDTGSGAESSFKSLKKQVDSLLAVNQTQAEELERERMRLAACGVAAMQNTEESKKERIDKTSPYWSASYGDICSTVDREIELRNKVEALLVSNQRSEENLAIVVEALEFYAKSQHIEDLKDDLENPSGEPENWVCDSDDKFNLENGGVARQALARIKGGGE